MRGAREEKPTQMEEEGSFYDKEGTLPGDEDWGGPEEIVQEKKEEKNTLGDLFKPAEEKTDLLANEQKSKITRDPRLKGLPEPKVAMPVEDDPWEMRVAEKKSEATAVAAVTEAVATAAIADDDDWGVREKYTPPKDNDKIKDTEAKPADDDDDWGVRDKSIEKGEIVEKNGLSGLEEELIKKTKHLLERSKSHSRKRSPPKKSRSPRK